MSTAFSNALKRIHDHGLEIFEGVLPQGASPAVLKDIAYPRSSIPEITALLGAFTDHVQKDGKLVEVTAYPDFPPLLFPSGRAGNMQDVFTNPFLFKVCRVTCYRTHFSQR